MNCSQKESMMRKTELSFFSFSEAGRTKRNVVKMKTFKDLHKINIKCGTIM